MKKKKTNDRIAIIFPGNIFTTPYLTRYTDLIENKGRKYDIIYWNGQGIEEESTAFRRICLDYPIASTSSFRKKIVGYFKFFRMARAALRKENYAKVILLTSVPAVCLYGTLRKRYAKRYLVDIRDYYKEYNRIYYSLEEKAIGQSALAVISSEGFKQFLPPHDYVIAHNINWILPETVQSVRSKQKDKTECIRLSFIGSMRFPKQDREVIDCFANDSRFHLNLFGSGYGIHEAYCAEKKTDNVTIIDRFPQEKTLELYGETDIVLNLYGNGSPALDYALSNKLYYAAQLGKPILVCPDTYMERISTAYGFGFTFDIRDPDIKNKLYAYFQQIDQTQFCAGCRDYLAKVRKEDDIFVKRVEEFLSIE